MTRSPRCIGPGAVVSLGLLLCSAPAEDGYRPIPLRSEITGTQPMTGLVFWSSSPHRKSPAISMEFAYLRYDEVARDRGAYDWSAVERLLSEAAGRGHQMVIRLHDTYPGRPSGVPAWIKAGAGYRDTQAPSEGKPTGFPDWTNSAWRSFLLEFISSFARKYDNDPRLAFLEVGFGLWGEYHIYDPGEQIGINFPDKAFQAEFLRHMAREFKVTRWLISKDAHVEKRTPLSTVPELLNLPFGVFDDTFHRAWQPGYNRTGIEFFGADRWKTSPRGGEQLIDSADFAGMISGQWQRQAEAFHISFMIAEQWPRWMQEEELKAHSAACGYRFKAERLETSGTMTRVTFRNTGAAPIYYDAFPAVNGVRAAESLTGLLPGELRKFTIPSANAAPTLTIECDRLVPGQRIGFEADLKP